MATQHTPPPPVQAHQKSDGQTVRRAHVLRQARARTRRAVPKERMSPKTCSYLTQTTIVATGHYNTVCRQNSIAFGSAPRREADSQPISPLARPAVSQTKTHSLGFLSVADAAPSSGEMVHLRASRQNGNAADRRPFGRRFEPQSGKYGAAAAADSRPTRIRTANRKLCVGCITLGPAVV